MDNNVCKSHISTKTTGKNDENKLGYNSDEFLKNENLNSQKFFENLENCRWLSCKDVAYLFSISENAIRIMVYRNQIRAYKFGRRLRFKYSDCVSLLQSKGTTNGY